MKKLTQYLEEVDAASPQVGDAMLFEDGDDVLVESHVVEILEDGIVIESDDDAEALLELNGYQLEAIQHYGAVGNSRGMGHTNEQDYGPGDHLDRIENGQLGNDGALAEEMPDQPENDANRNDPLLAKGLDDAAVPAMESDILSRILELAQVKETNDWVGKDTDRPAHLRKAAAQKPGSVAQKFRVPGDPNVPAQQRKIQPGDQPPQDKKITTAEGSGDPSTDKMSDQDLAEYIGKDAAWVAEHRDEAERMAHDISQDLAETMSRMRRNAGIMEDPTEEESMPSQGGVASEPQTSVPSEPGAAATRAFENRGGDSESPVAKAITQRILAQHMDLLQKYGPERLGKAIDAVARQVGEVDEIGSSDISGWVREVMQDVSTMRDLEEGLNVKQIKRDLDSGMSIDAVIGRHANKNLSNTDEIRRIIKQHAWEKRNKKPGVAEGKEDLSKYSTEQLKAYHDKHWGGGVPTFGKGALLKRIQAELKRRQQGVAEDQVNEAYINKTQDAINVLANLRKIGKSVELGTPYQGNLATEYANDVYDVYSWLSNRANEHDPKLAPILSAVFELRKQAKALETKQDSGSNRNFANQIVNTLYPLMQWIEDNVKDGQGVAEAEYHGRKVPLGKPMRGDVKKFKVYVRNPKTGNIKKVNFGDPDMRIKKSNPKRRKSFRARHRCATAKDRTSARYWSCRKW